MNNLLKFHTKKALISTGYFFVFFICKGGYIVEIILK